ncbi:MAG: FAD-dependent monooxygenase [Celeribacter sp.]
MTRQNTDILIAGGGIAGLSAAAALGAQGLRVVLVSPEAPITRGGDAGADLRSTAFLQPARALYEQIGLWERVAGRATPLEVLRIVDAVPTAQGPQVRDSREFHAGEIAETAGGPFGWNLLNWQVLDGLMELLAGMETVSLRFGTSVTGLVRRDAQAIARLADGSLVAARLVIGADGRDSAVREAAGIGHDLIRYGQKSLAFVATHEAPHDNASTEIYVEGGPFTTVPLPDLDGRPASAIVWMNPGPEAVRLAGLPEAEFNAAMRARSCDWLGAMELASRRAIFPIIGLKAQALTAQRVALVAEAAHVLPPIGAQGLNTSLNDIVALVAALEGAPDPGAPEVLDRYATARARDIGLRVQAIDLFNRVTRSGAPGLQALRLAGLRGLYGVTPLRRAVMRAGLSPMTGDG